MAMEFHIRGDLRERLKLDDLLFSYTGNVIFANVAASRKLAKALNDERGAETHPEKAVRAGALFAMGLIDELNHMLVAKFRRERDPAVLAEAARWIIARSTPEDLDKLLLQFTRQFPNTAIFRGKITAEQWLVGAAENLPNRDAALEELLLLWLANINPAFASFRELYEDKDLSRETIYKNATTSFQDYFRTRPKLTAESGSLLDVLRAPMLASPESLAGQLEFIREHWAQHLGDDLRRLLLAIDLVREEDLAIWLRFHPPGPDRHRHGAPGWGEIGFVGDEYIGFDELKRRYGRDYQAPLNEYEAFSSDQAWMPNVVMIAKSTFVWLEQLSKKYQRHIHRLDQVPDEELRLLAEHGLTALWLIGLWERSTASRTIKQMRGQYDAVASAYSLKSYNIASDLGGDEAFNNLKHRAAQFGVRIASDMVPNHMGIDSNWVIDHPDWFLSRWENPFPSYSFNGPDLSNDSRVEIKIEDHYYDQSDAAVVFRLRHHGSGETRYVYHGNDGTSFAWNDTAQLDYSKAFVREQVIQAILHVARLSPIIRFDAAMVLAKRHVQRLWFPLPGTGGSIPSRAESAMSQEEFDALMPHEFWREVVDRVAAEVPGTLLLAEAFWLLEGYFVRTLGMHRVYNSAFMHMLRDEENAKYRSYLKKTLEFDPEIMKRYVNFMSNPDERTAIDQFGAGDKYFGVATMLATLPGLPMFGHGQIEGFTERYGMEFKQARMNEQPNEGLIARHQREIAPLLHRRWLFAESVNFVLYDFWTAYGTVNENVYAYSNRAGGQRAVILYNNSYGSTHGTIDWSVASMDKGAGSLRQVRLGDGLALPGDGAIMAYRDQATGLEHLRRARDFHNSGLTLGLRGFERVVLLDWREFRSSAEWPWDRLCDELHGEGVPSVDAAMSMLRLRPLHELLRQALSTDTVKALGEESGNPAALGRNENANGRDADAAKLHAGLQSDVAQHPERFEPFLKRCGAFFSQVPASLLVENPALAAALDSTLMKEAAVADYRSRCRASMGGIARLPSATELFSGEWSAVERMLPHTDTDWVLVAAWIVTGSLPWPQESPQIFDCLRLRPALAGIFHAFGLEGDDAWRAAARVRVLLLHATSPDEHKFWSDGDVRWLAGVNEADGVAYVNKEQYENLIDWLQLPELLEIAVQSADPVPPLLEVEASVGHAREAAATAGYRLEEILHPAPDAPADGVESEAKVLPDGDESTTGS